MQNMTCCTIWQLKPTPEMTPSPPHVSTSMEPDIFSLLPTKRNAAPINMCDRKSKRTKTDAPKKQPKKRLPKKDRLRQWRPMNGRIALTWSRALRFSIHFCYLFLSYFECFSLLRIYSTWLRFHTYLCILKFNHLCRQRMKHWMKRWARTKVVTGHCRSPALLPLSFSRVLSNMDCVVSRSCDYKTSYLELHHYAALLRFNLSNAIRWTGGTAICRPSFHDRQ